MLLVTGCTTDDPSRDAAPEPDRRTGCGPISYGDVRGRPPAYLGKDELDRFPNDHAVCAGVWLRTGRGFIPQGVTVAGGTAWVSGFNGAAPVHYRYCIIQRVDVRTGKVLDRLDPVAGQVGDRDPLTCRHGGGLVRDEHGLWLVETSRLWLIDPETLDVDRVWALEPPLRGSFALIDGAGRLGVGRWYPHHSAQVDWFDPDAILGSSVLDVTPAMSSGSTAAPAGVRARRRGDGPRRRRLALGGQRVGHPALPGARRAARRTDADAPGRLGPRVLAAAGLHGLK